MWSKLYREYFYDVTGTERDGEMDLREYVRVLRRGWPLILVAAVLGVAAGVGLTLATTKVYRADVQTIASVASISSTSDLAQGANFVVSSVQSYTSIANSPTVTDAVVKAPGVDLSATQLGRQDHRRCAGRQGADQSARHGYRPAARGALGESCRCPVRHRGRGHCENRYAQRCPGREDDRDPSCRRADRADQAEQLAQRRTGVRARPARRDRRCRACATCSTRR